MLITDPGLVIAALLAALCLDWLCGEPSRWHPLVGFGRLANWVEVQCRHACGWLVTQIYSLIGCPQLDPDRGAVAEKLIGFFAWALLVVGLVLFFLMIRAWLPSQLLFLVDVVVLYFCIGCRSLWEHALAVAEPLHQNNLPEARKQLARIVSRDTQQLDNDEVAKATVETVLENGSDAVFAPIFWFLVAGAPGALMYRLANTLDAMWGYRTPAYRHFGWAAAKWDDVLNYAPARCCAISYGVAGGLCQRWFEIRENRLWGKPVNCFRNALQCWRQQAHLCDSPNGGVVMSAGAGALFVQLGGRACYHGEWREKPMLGMGNVVTAADIPRALQLLNASIAVWVMSLVLAWVLVF